ncbi:MAG: glycosyltransferase family 9 protein [Candidatus Binatia bacterium]
MGIIGWLAPRFAAADIDPRDALLKRILLVRANFRMGNALLALPAIAAFRKNFPEARIDFVGTPLSNLLFQGQPLNYHYVAPRRFPQVLWEYPLLMRRLRATRYDLAVEISCSQSGVGSFIVGLSGARIRAGNAGRWDRLFNLTIGKLSEDNKYRKLTEFLTALRLKHVETVGSLEFSPAERIEALKQLESFSGKKSEKTAGVFVGGRKLRGKRWPMKNFAEVINGLHRRGIRVVTFLGPEEKGIADSLRASIDSSVPVIFEPSARKFAAMIAHLDLLICCDSGPMHLACAAGACVVAIFREKDVLHWSPPASAARTVSAPNVVTASMVVQAALDELALGKSAGVAV